MPGGVQVHVRELTDHLRSRGHDVLVVAPAMASPSENGVRIVGRSIAVPYQGTVAPICPSPFSAVAIGRALAEFRPDLVHAHEPVAPSTSMFATIRSRAPVVATFHAHAERSALFDVAAPILKPVWRRSVLRVAVSHAAKSFVESRLGDDVRVIPNGVDVARFRDAKPAHDLPEGRRIAWVGRLDRQKGFPVALRAFELLARDDPHLHLVVAGDGRDRAAVDTLPLDVKDRVALLGTVPHPALPHYLAACDVFVGAATGQESFGMVLAEAMAAGLPVVATDIAGYREVVRDGVDGLLVRPSDAPALAAALGRVLGDTRLARRLAKGGRARADEFSWDAVTTRLEEAYQEALTR